MSRPIYCIDTSALIDGLERYYPESSFPKLWQNVEGLIGEKRLIISEEAWDEARTKDLAVKEWCDRQNRADWVINTNAAIATSVVNILKANPRIVANFKGKNRADPFVIAVALEHSAVVVTGEGRDGTASKPKIPYICEENKLDCCGFLELIQREHWSF